MGTPRANRRIHGVEDRWLDRVIGCRLFAYRLPVETFTPDESALGYWVSGEPVRPLERADVGNLIEKHAAAGIELRTLPALWPLWHEVIRSSLGFSGCRLSNARGEPKRDLAP